MTGRFSSFIWGGLVGLAVGILYAPRSGEETREELKKRADEYFEQGMHEFDDQKERVVEVVESGRKTAQEKGKELKTKVQETRERLKEQVDTAAEAAREKINLAASKVREITEASTPEGSKD